MTRARRSRDTGKAAACVLTRARAGRHPDGPHGAAHRRAARPGRARVMRGEGGGRGGALGRAASRAASVPAPPSAPPSATPGRCLSPPPLAAARGRCCSWSAPGTASSGPACRRRRRRRRRGGACRRRRRCCSPGAVRAWRRRTRRRSAARRRRRACRRAEYAHGWIRGACRWIRDVRGVGAWALACTQTSRLARRDAGTCVPGWAWSSASVPPYPSQHASLCLSARKYVRLPACLCTYPSSSVGVLLHIHLRIYPPTHLTIDLSAFHPSLPPLPSFVEFRCLNVFCLRISLVLAPSVSFSASANARVMLITRPLSRSRALALSLSLSFSLFSFSLNSLLLSLPIPPLLPP